MNTLHLSSSSTARYASARRRFSNR